MFMGTFEHSIDVKGRVIIPAKLRDGLGDSFVVTVGLDGCLYAYPMDEWEVFLSKLKELPEEEYPQEAPTMMELLLAEEPELTECLLLPRSCRAGR